MRLFTNPLLEEEASAIYDNTLPDHTTVVSAIIHLEDQDYYPNNIISLGRLADYGLSTDDLRLTLLMAEKEYRDIILANRDNFQVTIYIDHNGKRTSNRYKGILLNNPSNEMNPDGGRVYMGDAIDGDVTTVEIQCISLLFAILKQITKSGVFKKVRIDELLRHLISEEVGKVKIDSQLVKPRVDIVPIHNTRVYASIDLDNRVGILKLAEFLQSKKGIYNGGVGTYIHTDDVGELVTVYPRFNTSIDQGTRRRLVIYVSDMAGMPDVANKTCILEHGDLKIIVSTDTVKIDAGDTADLDSGGGFMTTNSNQVIDRTYTVKDGKLVTDKKKMIDSQSSGSKNGMSTVKMIGPTDNLYAVRTDIMSNKSKKTQFQWNFSRSDYLIPAMPVEIVRVRYNKVIREKGILSSYYTEYDNSYKNEATLLNVTLN